LAGRSTLPHSFNLRADGEDPQAALIDRWHPDPADKLSAATLARHKFPVPS
jgi:hypothetical protein